MNRRGMLVMPAEAKWMIERDAADPTSGSLRSDPLCFRALNRNPLLP